MNFKESIELTSDAIVSKDLGLGQFRILESDRIRNLLLGGGKERYEVLVATALAMDEKTSLPLINKFENCQYNYISILEEVYYKTSSLEYFNSLSLDMMYKVTVIMTIAEQNSGGEYDKKKQFYMNAFSRDYDRLIKVLKQQDQSGNYNFGEYIKQNKAETPAIKNICDAAIYFYLKEAAPFENEGLGLDFPIHLLATHFSNIIAMLHRDTYILCREGELNIGEDITEEIRIFLEKIGIGRWKLKQKNDFYQIFEKVFIKVRMNALIESKEEVGIGYMVGNSENPTSIGPCRFLGIEFKYNEFVYAYLLAKEWVNACEKETTSKVKSFSETVIVSIVRVAERQQKIEQNKNYLIYRLLGKYQGIEDEIKAFEKERNRALEEIQQVIGREHEKWESKITRVKNELQNTKQELKLTIENAKQIKKSEEQWKETELQLKRELERTRAERDNLLKLNEEYTNQLENIEDDTPIELPKKVVFITGHPNLRNNAKERFGWETVDIDKLNDMTKITNADLILYNAYSNTHTIFRKLKPEDLGKVVYTHGGTNLDVIERLAKNGWKSKIAQEIH